MTTLSLETALDITRHALVASRELSTAPLTIAVLDAGGHLLSLQREDGASMLRPQIAIGKAWGRWRWASRRACWRRTLSSAPRSLRQ